MHLLSDWLYLILLYYHTYSVLPPVVASTTIHVCTLFTSRGAGEPALDVVCG